MAPLDRRRILAPSAVAFVLALALPALAQQTGAPAPAPDKAGFAWIRIPGGEFSMGSANGEGDEKPVHPVKLHDFLIAQTEVTHSQWRAVVGSNHPSYADCDQCPVAMVSWDEAVGFIGQASSLLGEKLRLPTEAEWEYAARGGSAQHSWAGFDDAQSVKDYAWFNQNAQKKAHPVCEKKPNLFGICDMSGNLWEWCSDWYDVAYYDGLPAGTAAENPTGPAQGDARVLRGGSYSSGTFVVRATQRFQYWPGAQTPYIGFRPVKSSQ